MAGAIPIPMSEALPDFVKLAEAYPTPTVSAARIRAISMPRSGR